MTELVCTCRRHAVDARCPRHGWNRRAKFTLACACAYFSVVAIAVVVTAAQGAGG